MQTEIQAAKAALRKQIREALEKISPAVRAVESIELCERLKPQLQSARTILFFAPLPGEIDLWPLLEESVLAREKRRRCRGLIQPRKPTWRGAWKIRRAKSWPGNSACASRLPIARKFRREHLIWCSCRESRLI